MHLQQSNPLRFDHPLPLTSFVPGEGIGQDFFLPGEGLEPSCPCGLSILSRMRLPITPPWHCPPFFATAVCNRKLRHLKGASLMYHKRSGPELHRRIEVLQTSALTNFATGPLGKYSTLRSFFLAKYVVDSLAILFSQVEREINGRNVAQHGLEFQVVVKIGAHSL